MFTVRLKPGYSAARTSYRRRFISTGLCGESRDSLSPSEIKTVKFFFFLSLKEQNCKVRRFTDKSDEQSAGGELTVESR